MSLALDIVKYVGIATCVGCSYAWAYLTGKGHGLDLAQRIYRGEP